MGRDISIKRDFKLQPQCTRNIPSCSDGLVTVVALVDYRMRFIDVEVGWPGSVNDASIFKNSRLNHSLKAWLSQFPSSYVTTGYADNVTVQEEIPAFILGNSAYPNSVYIFPTFRLTRRKESGSPQFGPRPSRSLSDEQACVDFGLGVTGVLEEVIRRKGCVTDILGSMVESLVPLLLDMSLSSYLRILKKQSRY